jgi:two-component system, OmpR family, heavy metal sensor histidine kinase CusS
MPIPQKNSLWGTLRLRLTLQYTLLLVLMLGVTLLAVRIVSTRTMLADVDERLREDLVQMTRVVETTYPDLEAIRVVFDRTAQSHDTHGMFIHLADAKGKIIANNTHAPLNDYPFTLLERVEEIAIYTRYDVPITAERRDDVRIAKSGIVTPDGTTVWLRVGTSLRILYDGVNQLTNTTLLVGGIMLLVGPLLGYVMARRATEPIAEINRIVPSLQPRRLSDRLPTFQTGDELDVLSAQINELLDRIAAYVERNQTFTANAAHELRSPLAAIQNSVEVSLNEDRTIPEYQEILETVVHECSQLRLLVNQLLLLAENDSETAQSNFEPVNLSEIVRRSVAMFRDTAEERGVTLLTPRLDNCYVQGDPKRLRQVVNNLIDNGMKFNRPGGSVTLTIAQLPEESLVMLRVSDTGQGIPAEDLPYLFDRFYRGDKSHSREHTPGNGLGLSICESIIQAHQGKIEVTSTINEGTTFEVTLKSIPIPVTLERSAVALS